MLLHPGADAANGIYPVFLTLAAMQAGSRLPPTKQATDPRYFAWLFSRMHSGAWVRGCLVRLDPRLPPGFSYLAHTAARAAVGAEARFGGRPAEGHRPIPRAINASGVRTSVGGRSHELATLHPVLLACDDAATLPGVRTKGGRRLSDRPSHPAKRQLLGRKDDPDGFTGFATSWPPDPAIVAQSKCRGIAANRRRQPTCGSVDLPGLRSPSPNAGSMAVGTQGPVGGPIDLTVWLT
jgi:hypothetical protein